MKLWLKITIWTLFLAVILTILAITNSQQKKIALKTPKIHIDIQDENAFLTEKELYVRLKRKGLITPNQINNQLQLNTIEKFVNGMTEVLECNVYTKLGGDWAINVKIRRPIARVFNNLGESFYLDELGHTISPSYLYTAISIMLSFLKPAPLLSISITEYILSFSSISFWRILSRLQFYLFLPPKPNIPSTNFAPSRAKVVVKVRPARDFITDSNIPGSSFTGLVLKIAINFE